MNEAAPKAEQNSPALWQDNFPWPKPSQHKYDRGHTLVAGGPKYKAGAAKLAALAALRTGSGLVTIACHDEDADTYTASALSLMTMPMHDWHARLGEDRTNTVIIGPGAGISDDTRDLVLTSLAHRKYAVLDADALTAFENTPHALFSAIKSPCILTPHAGEFKRLFPFYAVEDKATAAHKAAVLSHAVIVYKGHETVIAAPDGRIASNTGAPPNLATAGSGDVLSGLCAGLLAQGMETFDAACAAVWLHGEAAKLQGEGLISEDIITHLPGALRAVKNYAMKTP